MFKTIWEALKEQTRLIGQNPAAAYGGVMTGINVVLFGVCLKLGAMLYQQMNYRVTDQTQSTKVVIELGRSVLEAQQLSRDAMGEARLSRDSAVMWRMLYEEQSRNHKQP